METDEGAAAGLHARSGALVSAPTVRRVRLLTSPVATLVLGRGQPDGHVDRAGVESLGLAVARRPSAGGAVLVGPGLTVWVDVLLPTGDELWLADVGRAAWWLGEAFAAALADVGLAGGEVWRGPMVRGSWSDRVCFAGLGAGEVTLAGRKVVGIAQRRTRWGALFQCAVPVTWDPSPLRRALAWSGVAPGVAELDAVARGIGADAAAALPAALVARLP